MTDPANQGATGHAAIAAFRHSAPHNLKDGFALPRQCRNSCTKAHPHPVAQASACALPPRVHLTSEPLCSAASTRMNRGADTPVCRAEMSLRTPDVVEIGMSPQEWEEKRRHECRRGRHECPRHTADNIRVRSISPGDRNPPHDIRRHGQFHARWHMLQLAGRAKLDGVPNATATPASGLFHEAHL